MSFLILLAVVALAAWAWNTARRPQRRGPGGNDGADAFSGDGGSSGPDCNDATGDSGGCDGGGDGGGD